MGTAHDSGYGLARALHNAGFQVIVYAEGECMKHLERSLGFDAAIVHEPGTTIDLTRRKIFILNRSRQGTQRGFQEFLARFLAEHIEIVHELHVVNEPLSSLQTDERQADL